MAIFRPSFLTLPKLETPPDTVLAYLETAFPHLPEGTWSSRMARGLVSSGPKFSGEVKDDTPYRVGLRIRYAREVENEPEWTGETPILFQNEHFLVVDKPPFMPVTPAGPWVGRSLLYQLEAATGLRDLAPIHRLDRETSGLVLFSVSQVARAAFHRLFMDALVKKEYEAMARLPKRPEQSEWVVENRLEREAGSLRMRVAEGQANSHSRIQLVETRDGFGRFLVLPRSGKKHQIRIHMNLIGFPIFNDRLYPSRLPPDDLQPSGRLGLLAKELGFRDPFSGEERSFTSLQSLPWP